MGENKIILDPNRLTGRSSYILGKVRNFSSKVSAFITVSEENEYLKEELLSLTNRLLTPIKLRVLCNLALIFVYITILFFMLKHIWNHFFSITPVSVLVVLIAFLVTVFIQLISDILKSDVQLLSKGKFKETGEKYEIKYNTVYIGLKRQKLWSILFSAILLALFLSGILFNSGLLDYISGVSDTLGYAFAIVFLTLSKPRKKLPFSVIVLFFFILVFEIRNITNYSVLDFIFLIFDATLYIPFFFYSLYDLLTFRDPTVSQPDIY
jgi:hypothetical protein